MENNLKKKKLIHKQRMTYSIYLSCFESGNLSFRKKKTGSLGNAFKYYNLIDFKLKMIHCMTFVEKKQYF